jgi:two-component sensor histidine kinase
VSWDGSSGLAWDAKQLRIASDAAGVALWSWNVDTDEIAMDERAHDLWGEPRTGSTITFEHLSAHIHPEDLDRVRADFEATRAVVGAYEIEFRILDGETVRWISARGQGDDSGIVGRIMFGVFLDATQRKQAEEARELIAGEMSHRVKNLFSVAVALTTIAARSAATTTEMATDLTRRLVALGHAHDLVRPLPGHAQGHGARLDDLLRILLAPYDEKGAVSPRFHVSVPNLHVGEVAVTPLALIVHELATNAIKYGALSKAEGTVDVACSIHHHKVVMVWTEQGGPTVAMPCGKRGFGSNLVARTVSGQFGGSISVDWASEGIVATLTMDKARLSA